MEQPELELLRRKLDALSYDHPVDEYSGPLVQRLVDDLVHTTESYRGLRQQAVASTNHISDLNDKVQLLQKDCSRLASENNQLHLRVIKETEHSDRREREHYQQLKALEEQIAQLSYWKHSTQHRLLELDQENGGLKQRLQQLLSEDESEDEGRGFARLDMTSPPQPAAAAQLPRPMLHQNTGDGGIDLLKAANARVAALETAVRARDKELAAAQAELQTAQEAVERREAEIVRLGAEAGGSRDLDVTALQYRSEAQENLILQLNEQVEFLTGQVAGAQAELSMRSDATGLLEESEQARRELESRLREAVRDGNALAREVGELKAALKRAQAAGHGNGLPAKRQGLPNGRAATDKENLPDMSRALALAERRLSEAAAELQARAEALRRLEAERDEGNAQIKRLKERLEEVEGAVAQLRAEGADVLAGGVYPGTGDGSPSAAAEMAALREHLAVAEAAAAAAVAERDAAQHEASQLRSKVQFLEDEKAVLQEEAAARSAPTEADKNASSLRQRLEAAEADRDKLRAAVLQAQVQADELIAALRSLAAERDAAAVAAAAARAEAERLRKELSERSGPAAPVVSTEQVAASADHASADRAAQLEKELQALREQAQTSAAEVERLQGLLQEVGGARDSLTAELKSKSEDAAALTQEVVAAQERAEVATQRAAQAEAASAAAAGQVLSAQQAVARAEQQRDAAQQRLNALEAENMELRDELHAVSDDLEALVRENQAIGGQCIAASTERDAWREDAAAANTRAAAAEAATRAADADTERLRKSYEALAAEHRAAQGNAGALDRELAARDGQAAGQAAELAALREAHAKAQAQLNQSALDVQAWERQVAELSRQVSRAAADKDDAERERQSLLDALRNSEQARFDVERQREGAQRQLAALDGKLRECAARCEEAEAQAEGTRRQLAVEGTRVNELEALLARVRASHFEAARLPGGLPGQPAQPPGPDHAAFRRLAERAAALEAKLATAEAELGSVRSVLQQARIDNSTLEAALQAARTERNALNAAIRASSSGTASAPDRAFGNMDANAGAAALASARADLAVACEENGRLLDLVSKVDAERAMLEKANTALKAGLLPHRQLHSPSASSSIACSESAAGTAFRGAPSDAEVEAARLALELAHERAQREKAERDFEELLEGMQAGPGGATSARRSATSASPRSTPAEEQRRRLSDLQAAVRDLEADNKRLKEGLSAPRPATTASALTSNGDSGATWRRHSRSSGPTGALAAYVAELSGPNSLTSSLGSRSSASSAKYSPLTTPRYTH